MARADLYEVQLGTTARAPVTTRSYEGGPPTAPVTAPTVAGVWKNDVFDATLQTAATVPQKVDAGAVPIPGRYTLTIPTTGLAIHDYIEVVVRAEYTTGVFLETTKTFRIVQEAGLNPILE